MKKYAVIIMCLAMASGAVIGQTGSSSSGSGTGTSSGSSLNEPSGSSTSGTSGTGTSGTSKDTSGAISEPSGAEAQSPGVITIQGTVSSERERQQIEQQLEQVSGVKSVVNKLKVSGQSGSSLSEPSGAAPKSDTHDRGGSSNP